MVRLPLLIDENVPESVTEVFRQRGHEITYVRELCLAGTPDPIVAAIGNRMEAIVVTWNHRDFKKLAARVPKGGQAAFRKLGRISFRCNEARGRFRAEEIMETIEEEYARTQRRRDKRLLIEVTETRISIIR